MIETQHPKLSIRKQCKLLNVNRNRLKPPPTKTSTQDEEIMKHLDELYLKRPFFGQRKLMHYLEANYGWKVGRKRIRRLMKIMGIEALVPKPNTSKPSPGHKIYPYLLRQRTITEADEVWCADITYIPMPKGHVYLIAIMDWHTRAVLSWELSNTMDSGFCVRALTKAFELTGTKPRIFNTDQGSQFTSSDWINELKAKGIKISMDGRGRWMDNVFIERLWRSIKYEQIRLYSYDSLAELRSQISDWMDFYNHERIHQALANQTPWSEYRPTANLKAAS
ncbi:IS3 family transposase [Akkermansiaceae bacterium]|nr:IS3 family transposase [Akkermansiaceae bacterium]